MSTEAHSILLKYALRRITRTALLYECIHNKLHRSNKNMYKEYKEAAGVFKLHLDI